MCPPRLHSPSFPHRQGVPKVSWPHHFRDPNMLTPPFAQSPHLHGRPLCTPLIARPPPALCKRVCRRDSAPAQSLPPGLRHPSPRFTCPALPCPHALPLCAHAGGRRRDNAPTLSPLHPGYANPAPRLMRPTLPACPPPLRACRGVQEGQRAHPQSPPLLRFGHVSPSFFLLDSLRLRAETPMTPVDSDS